MARLRYSVKNLKQWVRAAASPALFEATLRKNMREATEINGKIAEAAQRAAIRSGGFKPNAPLTVMIKHSRKPLVHHGDLFQGITSKVVDDFTVFTGVLKNDADYNVAEIVYGGVTIKVTPAMRGMFFFLSRVSAGEMDPSQLTGRAAELWSMAPGGWKALRPATTAIVIPPRPWTKVAFEEPGFQEKIRKNWERAIQRTFHDMARP